jgi:hypothetical protein
LTKAQIIEKVLRDFRNVSEETGIPERDDVDYEKVIVAALEKSLRTAKADTEMRTCEDFGVLNVKCCRCCHGIYQHFEVSLIEIESGGSAWICCALDRALNPMKHAGDTKLPDNCTFDEMLAEFIRWSEDAK